MNARHDLDRELTAFLREGPTELPYESFDAVRDRTEQTRQRVLIGPWRTPIMNKFVTYSLGTAAVVAIALFVGAQVFGSPTGGFGSQNSPTPEPSLSVTTGPTPSPTYVPPLTGRFTSAQHGISMSYPRGWMVQAATEPWTDSTFPLNFGVSQADFLYDRTLTDHLFLTIASQPIGDSVPREWVAEQMASDEGCTASGPTTVDGANGLIGAVGCDVAVIATASRGYWIQLYTSDDIWLGPPYDRTYSRTLFLSVLATVQLHPKDAAD